MTATIVPFQASFGAEVRGIDLSQPLDDRARGTLHRAFLDHGVISLRGQADLTPRQVLDASHVFGFELEPHLFSDYHHPATPLIIVLSNRRDADTGAPLGLADAGSFWHSDLSYKPRPARATLLYAIEVPAEGGDTLFCDMLDAWQALPDAMKDRLEGLTAIHNYAHTPRDIFTSGRVEPPPVPLSGGSERLASALGSFVSGGLRSGVGALTALARPAAARANLERLRSAAFAALHLATDEVPELPWNGPIGPERRLAFTRIPMQGVRHIRSRLGGTVNDVVLSIVAGGLHRQLVSVGMSLRGVELTTMVPVSLRSADEAASLGNRISAMLIPLAVDLESEIARYAATCAITDRLKARADWVGIDALLALLDGLPPALVAGVGKRLRIGRLANLITTNVPGPRETRWLCGRRVEGLRPLVPIVDGIGLGIAIFSYDGWLEIGINADAARVPDLEKLQRGIESAFASLLASA